MKPPPKTVSGFSLIELLICLVVIGVLITLAVPASHHQRVTGEMVGTLSNMRQLHLATETMSLETYRAGG